MIYMNVLVSDLLANKVFTQKEWEFLDTLRIPFNDTEGLWFKKRLLDIQVKESVKSGNAQEIKPEYVERRQSAYVQSDCMGEGVQGIKSMADGKLYDSKSAYRKSLKEKGLVELGNDAPVVGKGPEASISERELKQDIKTAIEQLGG